MIIVAIMHGTLGAFIIAFHNVWQGWPIIVTLLGWMTAARHEYVKTVEADSTGHLETLPDPKTPKLMLTGLAILLVAAFVIQVGWIPPRAAGGEASPGASGAPPAEGGGSGGGEPPASGEPPGSP